MLLNLFEAQKVNTQSLSSPLHIEQGLDYFGKAIESNSASDLKSGIYNLIKGFELCTDKINVIEFFDDTFFAPVKDAILENYNDNIKHFCDNDESLFPSFDDLHVYVINDEEYFCYNFKSKTFLYYGKWDNKDYLASMMMVESRENLEADKFFIDTLEFVKKASSHRNAIIKLNRQIEKGNFDNILALKNDIYTNYDWHEALDYCLAKYYYETRQYSLALNSIVKALKFSRITPQYNLLAAKILLLLDEYEKSLFYAFRSARTDKKNYFFASDLLKTLYDNAPEDNQTSLLYIVSLLYTNPCFFPRYNAVTYKNHLLQARDSILENDFFDITAFELPAFKGDDDSPYKLFITDSDTGYRDISHSFDTLLSKSEHPSIFHLIKRELVKFTCLENCDAKHLGIDYVLPVLSQTDQVLTINYDNKTKPLELYINNIEYIRVTRNLLITAEKVFFVGKPIYLTHFPHHKKLIANIFVDSLSMTYLLKNNFEDAPNIKRFFEKGVMFANTYSSAEHTIPSLPSIKTGCYPHKTQIFERTVMVCLDDDIKLFADYFSKENYYCSDFICTIEEPYFNTSRSMDRVVCQLGAKYTIDKAVSDAIKHLRAFSEADNYLEITLDTPHRILENTSKDLELQTKEPVENITYLDSSTPSVWQTKSEEKEIAYKYAIKNTDNELARIFDYVDKNYNKEEYVITLFSDHGTPVLYDEKWILKKSQINSCFFICGGDIKPCGVYKDEIVSSMDILPSVLNACNIAPKENIDGVLPVIFGGKGREYAITQSVFEGQTYKISIHTLTHEFRFESNCFTTIDGKIDTENGNYSMIDNNTNLPCFDTQLVKYFLDIIREHTKTRLIGDKVI